MQMVKSVKMHFAREIAATNDYYYSDRIYQMKQILKEKYDFFEGKKMYAVYRYICVQT